MMNKRWMQLLGMISCVALVVSCKQAPSVEMEAEYAVLQVQPSDKVISTTYSATIRGRQDIDIYPQVSGFITKLCVEEGQMVRRGRSGSLSSSFADCGGKCGGCYGFTGDSQADLRQ